MKAPENQKKDNSPEPGQNGDALSQAFFRDSNVADLQQGPSDSFPVILRKLAWFILPVICLLVLLDLVLRWQLPEETLLPYMQKELACYTLKVDRLASGPAPDLLFLGSSRIRDGAVPTYCEKALERIWNRPARVYNAGLAGAALEEYGALAFSHLPDPPPPYVVTGITAILVI